MLTKFEYLVRTLSRTNRKDYENYVINRIWNQLDDPTLKPVTQQYVKRPQGYALIDLYFPQLNIGIECDELHHVFQEKHDVQRCWDISQVIGSQHDYLELRIPIFTGKQKPQKKDQKKIEYEMRSLEEIDRDIQDAVAKIQAKKAEKIRQNAFQPWDEVSDLSKALAKGFITVEDAYTFTDQTEVRTFFGRIGTEQRSCYTISKDTGDHIWTPNLAIEQDGSYTVPKKHLKHLNILSEDGMTVFESIHTQEHLDSVKQGESHRRYIFAKYFDPVLHHTFFRFVGVFQRQAKTVYKDINGRQTLFCVHRQVGDRVFGVQPH